MNSPRRRQRGAVAVLAAIATLAGLSALALAIDVARLYTAQRDLQRLSDLAALDAARVAGGCMGVQAEPAQAAYNEVVDSVVRNRRGAADVTPLSVVLGRRYRAADGRFYFISEPERTSYAVEVSLTRPMPTRLLGFGAAEGGRLVAVSAARSRPYASLQVGSQLATLDPDFLNRFLNATLGGALALDAVGYRSLLSAEVPLDDLLDQLGPETPGETIEREVSIPGLLDALVTALTNAGNTAAANTAALIAEGARTTGSVLPSELIAVDPEVIDTLSSSLINAGQLTLVAAQAATDTAAIQLLYSLPPPLGNSIVTIRIVEPAQQAASTPGGLGDEQTENYAANGQALVQLDLGVPIEQLGVKLRLPLWVQAAQATAEVSDIFCAREGQPYDTVVVEARTSVARLGIGDFDDIESADPEPRPATLLDVNVAEGALGVPLPLRVRVTAAAVADIPSESKTLTFTSPFEEPQEIGGPIQLRDALLGLPSGLQLDIKVSPIDGDAVDGLLQPVLDLVRPALESTIRSAIAAALLSTGDALVGGAMSGAGIGLGGSEVTVHSVEGEQPRLFIR